MNLNYESRMKFKIYLGSAKNIVGMQNPNHSL